MLNMLMKKRLFYLIFIVITLFIGNVNGQTVQEVKSKTEIEWIIPNQVGFFTLSDNYTTQRGKFYIRGRKYVRDGEWTLHINNELRTVVKYDMGNVLWVKRPKHNVITTQMIEIHRLKERIALLEKKIENS